MRMIALKASMVPADIAAYAAGCFMAGMMFSSIVTRYMVSYMDERYLPKGRNDDADARHDEEKSDKPIECSCSRIGRTDANYHDADKEREHGKPNTHGAAKTQAMSS